MTESADLVPITRLIPASVAKRLKTSLVALRNLDVKKSVDKN
jgi:hypothetical protein